MMPDESAAKLCPAAFCAGTTVLSMPRGDFAYTPTVTATEV